MNKQPRIPDCSNCLSWMRISNRVLNDREVAAIRAEEREKVLDELVSKLSEFDCNDGTQPTYESYMLEKIIQSLREVS